MRFLLLLLIISSCIDKYSTTTEDIGLPKKVLYIFDGEVVDSLCEQDYIKSESITKHQHNRPSITISVSSRSYVVPCDSFKVVKVVILAKNEDGSYYFASEEEFTEKDNEFLKTIKHLQ